MKDGLRIEDPLKLPLLTFIDCLNSLCNDRKVKTNGHIIIKLTNFSDKCRIFAVLSLRLYNQDRRLLNQSAMYITEHLSQEFQLERKRLLPLSKEARRRNRKTFWKAENSHYALCVNDVKVENK